MKPESYKLSRYPETLAVVRLGPGTEVPKWAESSSLFSITATATETSIVCAARTVVATLGTLVEVAEREKVVSPALIVIGHIVSLRKKLRGNR